MNDECRAAISYPLGVNLDQPFGDARELAALIDHTLLKPEALESDIAVICEQARQHGFASVCVNPYWVPFVTKKLSGSGVKTCSVVGFPLGANQTAIKVSEAELAVEQGASEIDMVINVGVLRAGGSLLSEIEQIAGVAHAGGAILKVIIETCLLADEQKRLACTMAKEAGADFVKTSTGFASSGATEADVKLMRDVVGSALGVKASGGVRTLEAVTRMVRAGANRIGTSSGVHILAEFSAPGVNIAIGDGRSY